MYKVLLIFTLLLYLGALRWSWRFFLPAFGLHTLLLLTRVILLHRPPVANMAETLLYVPWVSSLLGILLRHPRSASLVALTLLLLSPFDLPLSHVQPVLNSNLWLTVHVLMVVGSYGIFFLAGLLAHIHLLTKRTFERSILTSLYLGTTLLILGTLLGGVWAAQSWGRFWDWDPKESWAFISSAFYLLIIHAYRYKKIASRGLAIGAVAGLLFITFTWYGVNYILGTGLHSYGFGHGGEPLYYLYLALEALFLISVSIWKRKV